MSPESMTNVNNNNLRFVVPFITIVSLELAHVFLQIRTKYNSLDKLLDHRRQVSDHKGQKKERTCEPISLGSPDSNSYLNTIRYLWDSVTRTKNNRYVNVLVNVLNIWKYHVGCDLNDLRTNVNILFCLKKQLS